MITSLRSVHTATLRGAPGSRVPLTNGLTRTRMSRRHPNDRPIFIPQGWPQAMNHLPWTATTRRAIACSRSSTPAMLTRVVEAIDERLGAALELTRT
jgi:hypothetical protein